MTISKNHPHRRCPKCGERKRIRKGKKHCFMCRAAAKSKRKKVT